MTARSASPRVVSRPKTDLPPASRLFQQSLTAWRAEYKARKAAPPAKPADPKK